VVLDRNEKNGPDFIEALTRCDKTKDENSQ